MNHIYRSVWNEITRTYVAAAEIVRGKGKGSKSSRSAEGSEATLEDGSMLTGATGEQGPPAQPAGLRFGGFRSMALEQRFMFDGAAVADATTTLSKPTQLDGGLLQFSNGAENLTRALNAAQQQAEKLVAEYMQQPDAASRLFALFNGGQSAPNAQWMQSAQDLVSKVTGDGYSVSIELRSNTELRGAMAAFAAQGEKGTAVIYLNSDWVRMGPDTAAIERVLVEEIGHSLDVALTKVSESRVTFVES